VTLNNLDRILQHFGWWLCDVNCFDVWQSPGNFVTCLPYTLKPLRRVLPFSREKHRPRRIENEHQIGRRKDVREEARSHLLPGWQTLDKQVDQSVIDVAVEYYDGSPPFAGCSNEKAVRIFKQLVHEAHHFAAHTQHPSDRGT
jgi:hypothetical protein